MAAARLAASLLLLAAQVACEFGVLRVVPQSGGTRGRDYCILYNPQWAHLPHDLNKVSLLKLRDLSTTQLCSHLDVPVEDFTNQIALVARGNCTFYEKVRLAQGSGAHGLLIVSKERLVPPRGNKTQYEEISIPVALLSHRDLQDIFRRFGHEVMVALYAPSEPVMDYNMVIIFIMAVGTVALGGYWAGSHDVKKRYMKHKRDDVPEKQEDEAVDVTPVMICVFVVMCCFMLVLLYYFYDRLVYVIIGIFCLASSTGLYSCLAPCVRKLPFCTCRVPDNNLPYFHKRPQARMLLLALFCVTVSVVWGVFRNEDQWAWVLQDTLGIAFCLYMLRTIRLPTFKVRAAMAGQVNSWWGAEGLGAQVSRAVLAPTGLHTAAAGALRLRHLLRLHHPLPDQGRSPLPSQLPAPPLPWLTTCLVQSGNSIMVEVATGPSNSSTHEKLPMVLKVPRLNTSPLSLCDRPFSLLGFGDILVPGLLVAYCHRFDIQVQSSRIYFVACTIAYGLGLLVTFVALVLMRHGQPALLYLVPCTLLTSCTVALWRREMGAFWTGSGFAKDAPQTPWAAPQGPVPPKDVDASLSEQPRGEELAQSPLATEEAGATDPAKDPDSPVAGPLSPSNGDQVQPIPVVTPGTSA
ncbi:signal peptide peptidase-like 2B isoform X7 [Rattus norvegicus]|uniref:signal peptide peptidase-like 2B isoform X7 n=1 Tax=Rattus norvegicus TaxID=10116 RepID=UPI0004E483DC|nr:signal peptide peptidase-like 2B isoform X1 [Rattus norvegicus]|eukprot:XP_008763333.1 PREDICTED: signal peptide peptidase-like 2B isoform X1 [Rattus norvegicus]